MKRILIIGCSGSGKSTLARRLGTQTGLPVYHIDQLFWRPNWMNISNGELEANLTRIVAEPAWIIDGNYNRTLPMRLERANTVVWLDYSRMRCLSHVFWRLLTNLGQAREDMNPGCKERMDWEFLTWVWNFNKTQRPRTLEMLANYPQVNLLMLRNDHEVQNWLKTIDSATVA